MLTRKKVFTKQLATFSVVVACNNDTVLKDSLMRSPELTSIKEIILRHGFTSASNAYNSGLDAATSEVVVFAHQDVFFPDGWFHSLAETIATLSASDPNWAVLGVYGITLVGQGVGYLYSTGIKRLLGAAFSKPVEVSSLDEVVLIVRRSSGLRFDEGLPGFHLYGTDICLEAKQRGLKNYVVSNFCVHNSKGLDRLPGEYTQALNYIRDKWREYLPIRTPCMTITRWGIPLIRHRIESLFWRNRKVGGRCADPSAVYDQLIKSKLVERVAQR